LGLPADILPDVAISKEIEEKKKQYFSTTSPSEKNKIRETINSLFSQLMENIKKYDPTIADINFDFHTHFSEVFHANGGFDIVIANPPYVGEKGHKEMFREIRKGSLMKFYQRKMDLFYFFFHLAINLGKQDSIIAFITTNYYPTATGGKKLRGDFKGRAIISRLINLNELKIFESALGQHNMITILQKRSNENAIANTCITKRKGDTKPEILQAIVDWKDAGTDYFQIAQKDLYDGAECYIRLAGSAKISNNPTQILLEKVKSKADPLIIFCHVNMGVQSGADAIGKKLLKRALDQNYTNKNYLLKNQINIGDKIYIIDRLFLNKLPLSERSIIKPFIKNSEIKDYFIPYAYNQYYIYADSKVDINEFPTIKQHLLKFRPILNAREQVGDSEDSWYWIRGSNREFLINTGPHIVCPYRSKKNIFALTDGNIIGAGDIYYITKKDLSVSLNYILALLNSKLYYLWLYHRGKRKGEILELYQQPLSEIPIKKGSESEQKPFIEIVDKILAITKSNDYLQNPIKQAKVKEYEEEIDQMVYKLYGLTEDEIKIVEGEK
jgi:adenine-specific DNA-methyltransferase